MNTAIPAVIAGMDITDGFYERTSRTAYSENKE